MIAPILPILAMRALRSLADTVVALAIPLYLYTIGYTSIFVGALSTVMLVGTTISILVVGSLAHRMELRTMLCLAALMMVTTGAGYTLFSNFAILLAIAIMGSINPSGGDVNVFRPLEYSALSWLAPEGTQTTAYALYSVVGMLFAAMGAALFSALDSITAQFSPDLIYRTVFISYSVVGVVVLVVYGFGRSAGSPVVRPKPLTKGRSRRSVWRLTALFAIDAFGGGFVVNTILILWLVQRFGMSVAEVGTLFVLANLGAACMQLASGPISRRLGVVGTMLVGHLPASVLLVVAGVSPDPLLASVCLVLRGLLSQLDVPARTSLVTGEVGAAERAAAISFTTVPFAFAAAFPPLISGWLLSVSSFGWPLIIAGVIRLIYGVLLYSAFGPSRNMRNL